MVCANDPIFCAALTVDSFVDKQSQVSRLWVFVVEKMFSGFENILSKAETIFSPIETLVSTLNTQATFR